MSSIPLLVISTCVIAAAVLIAHLFRQLTLLLMPHGLGRTAVLEAIASAEMCACCYELIIVVDKYGPLSYGFFLLVLNIWWLKHWGDVTGCPYNHLESLVQGKMGTEETLVRIVAQFFGGVCVYRWVYFLWTFEVADEHVGRWRETTLEFCVADLRVGVLYGTVCEILGTLLCRLTAKYLDEHAMDNYYSDCMDSFISTTLVVSAFDTSGGYYNPVLATSVNFGCRGHTALEHIVVYWIGPVIGSIASIYLYPHVKEHMAKAPSQTSVKQE